MATRASPSPRVRLIKEEEFEEVLAIAWRHMMYVRRKKVLNHYRRGLLKILVAVYPTGDIVGTLWILIPQENNWTLVSGITLRDPHSAAVKYQLFEGARSFILPEKLVYFNAPMSLRSYFITLPYRNCGNLHLYTCHSSEILLPICEVRNYLVARNKRSHHEISCVIREEENAVGKGTVIYSENHWFIKRLFARNEMVRKLLFRHLLEEVKTSVFSGVVSIYINERKYGSTDIREFGLVKHPSEWTSYCSIEPRVQAFEDTKKGLCGVDSIVLEML